MSKASDRAATGAELLDGAYPRWFDSIDLATLDLADAKRCVLGQRFGGFAAGLREVLGDLELLEEWNDLAGAGTRWAIDHGFNIDWRNVSVGDPVHARRFDRLTAAWRELIRARVDRGEEVTA